MRSLLIRVLEYIAKNKIQKVAVLGCGFKAGRKSKVYASESASVHFGEHVSFHAKAYVSDGGTLVIGKNSTLRFNTEINAKESVKIGANVIISNHVIISDNNSHPTGCVERIKMCESDHDGELWSNKYAVSKPIIIEDNVWVGRQVLINKGVTIGEGSIIAAGSVVTKNIPPYSLCYGNPGKVIEGKYRK